MIKQIIRKKIRSAKHKSIRKKIFGTASKPRLCIYRSLKNIYAQIIDDENDVTLVSCSSLEKELSKDVKNGGNKNAAKIVGKELAKRALDKKIEKVIFDRGGLLYHGRIKELADGAREGGLKF